MKMYLIDNDVGSGGNHHAAKKYLQWVSLAKCATRLLEYIKSNAHKANFMAKKPIKEGTTLQCPKRWACVYPPYPPCGPACPVEVVPKGSK